MNITNTAFPAFADSQIEAVNTLLEEDESFGARTFEGKKFNPLRSSLLDIVGGQLIQSVYIRLNF